MLGKFSSIRLIYTIVKRNTAFPIYIYIYIYSAYESSTKNSYKYFSDSQLFFFSHHYSFCIPTRMKSVEIISTKSDRSPGSICWSTFAIPCGYQNGGRIMAQGKVAHTSGMRTGSSLDFHLRKSAGQMCIVRLYSISSNSSSSGISNVIV
jgi:hypothetical protein